MRNRAELLRDSQSIGREHRESPRESNSPVARASGGLPLLDSALSLLDSQSIGRARLAFPMVSRCSGSPDARRAGPQSALAQRSSSRCAVSERSAPVSEHSSLSPHREHSTVTRSSPPWLLAMCCSTPTATSRPRSPSGVSRFLMALKVSAPHQSTRALVARNPRRLALAPAPGLSPRDRASAELDSAARIGHGSGVDRRSGGNPEAIDREGNGGPARSALPGAPPAGGWRERPRAGRVLREILRTPGGERA